MTTLNINIEKMTNKLIFSKRLHLATLCCFLLPFFYTGCGEPSAEEKAAKEKALQDSVAATTNRTLISTQETIAKKSTDYKSEKSTAQTETELLKPDTNKTSKKEETPSEQISNKFSFLRPILMPKADTYSGLGAVINVTPFIRLFAIVISFLFLLLCFVIKFIDNKALKTIALLDILVLVFLIVSQPYSWDFHTLWGFWVAVIFSFTLTLCDFYIIKLNKRSTTAER